MSKKPEQIVMVACEDPTPNPTPWSCCVLVNGKSYEGKFATKAEAIAYLVQVTEGTDK